MDKTQIVAKAVFYRSSSSINNISRYIKVNKNYISRYIWINICKFIYINKNKGIYNRYKWI